MLNTYPLYNLSEDEFESIVGSICKDLFGIGIGLFSKGKDGGRDATFEGKAIRFPSENTPWEGKMVIQAKHTTKINGSCSDYDFKSVLEKEVKSIKDLKNKSKIDYYILFTNRKLSGLTFGKISDFIESDVGVTNFIIGEERLQGYLRDNPQIAKNHRLSNLFAPISFYEEDFVEMVEIFSQINFSEIDTTEIEKKFKKIPIEKKIELNNVTEEYFNLVFKKSYNTFSGINNFMKGNKECAKKYQDTVNDLQAEITTNRTEFAKFDDIFEYLFKYIIEQSPGIEKNRSLVRILLHYMFFMCDIGKS